MSTGRLRLRLKVQPKARRSAIQGVIRDAEGEVALKIAVSAAPEGGKANAAVAALLAETLGVAKSAVSVVAGATDRCGGDSRRSRGAGRAARGGD